MTDVSVLSADTDEQWRPVVGFEGWYEVSNLGRVRSLDRFVRTHGCGGHAKRRVRGRVLKPVRHSGGYAQVGINGRVRLVHALVAEAFIGPRPPGKEVCHGPKGQADNSAKNLRYDSHLANCADRREQGGDVIGERNGMAKINAAAALRIRELSGRMRQCDIGDIFGISQTQVGRICNGKRWKHV